jgi:hypothetical protein
MTHASPSPVHSAHVGQVLKVHYRWHLRGDNQGEIRIASPKMFLNIQPLPHIICRLDENGRFD